MVTPPTAQPGTYIRQATMQIELMLDPTGYYEANCGHDWYDKVTGAIGILAAFTVGDQESIADNMQNNYQFFYEWTTGYDASVDDKGCFCFPGDPEQYPLMLARHGDEVVYIYQNSMVAQTIDGKLTKWTRMD